MLSSKAGFTEIHLELNVEVKPNHSANWEGMLRTAPNPKIPTLEEAMQEALTAKESEALIGYLRPLVEAQRGVKYSARAYPWALK